MTQLKERIHELRAFIPSADQSLLREFDAITKKIQEANKNNLIAQIPIGHFSEEKFSISDLEVYSDYEIVSGSYVDREGNKFASKEEYEKHLREVAEKNIVIQIQWGKKTEENFDDLELFSDKDTAIKALNVQEDVLIPFYVVVNVEEEAEHAWLESNEEAENERIDCMETWIEDQLNNFDGFDFLEDEISTSMVYRYNHHVDEAIAKKVGLGVLRFLKGQYQNECFLFHLGSGTSFDSYFLAYQALVYGCIEDEFASHLMASKKYLDESLFQDVMNALNLRNFR